MADSVRRLFALLKDADVSDRADRLTLVGYLIRRDVDSLTNLSEIELRAVIDILEYWRKIKELRDRCATAIDEYRARLGESAAPVESKVVTSAPTRDSGGRQLIQVKFSPTGASFTYAWDGEGELKVGDEVVTPTAVATVCALGSHYDGKVSVITNRAEVIRW